LPELPIEPLWEAKIDWTRHQGVAEIKVKGRGAVLETELHTDSRPTVISSMLDTLISGKTQVIGS
jgi:acetate kinase